MAQAAKDNNNVSTIVGVLNTDGETPIRLKVDPTSHGINESDGTSGSDLGGNEIARDSNSVTVLAGVSESDGVTPVNIYFDSDGKWMVDSN